MKIDKQRWPALAALSVAIGLTLAAGSCDAEQGDITLHTVSVHVGAPGLNNINPGVAYDVTDNVRVGGLYNSYKKPSVYAAYLYPLSSRFRIGAGIVTGYAIDGRRIKGKTVSAIPLLAAEFDVTKRLSVIWFGQAFNLEVKF